MKKKLIAMAGILCLTFSLAACGTTNSNNEVTPTNAPTKAPVEDVTPEPTPDTDITPLPDDVPVETPGSENSEDVIMAFFDKVKEQLPNDYFANMPMTKEDIVARYNIPEGAVKFAYGEIPMISANIDTLVAVEAVDAGNAEIVKASFDNYIQVLKDDAFQYPKNAACIPAMKVITKDNYVFLVGIFGDVMVGDEPTDESMLTIAKTTVDKVVSIIDESF